MRLRNIKNAPEKIIESKYVIKNPEEQKGQWKEIFQNDNPIYIEIGMGKGKLITEMAKENRNINYIGIEKYSSVIVRAVERVEKEYEGDNLLLIRMNAEEIMNVFAQNEVSRIYLNFSDPWPKDRHAKRRLTSTVYLERYRNILINDGDIIFTTDNVELFEFSLEQIKEAKLDLVLMTKNLHENSDIPTSLMTEYEEKFVNEGKPICRLIVKMKKNFENESKKELKR